jgi:hypothetical protein
VLGELCIYRICIIQARQFSGEIACLTLSSGRRDIFVGDFTEKSKDLQPNILFQCQSDILPLSNN